MVMLSNPENRIPNPMKILPISLEFLNLNPMIKMIPTINATGASVDGLKICNQLVAEESISKRRMI